MGELRNRKRVSFSLDHKTVERLSDLSEQTGITRTKLLDWAVYEIYKKQERGESLKPENYFDSTERES
ncbi:ribbon-helix-helix domain-containing protein [Exiguobacterium sp. ZWU0009]|uniref:ribbon-helix-helix domain-containing protein n=1 Tax=Exiguobacterium sp. ZWU0009 TaxID=1224749 RepID=UPI000646A72C|nr:ribbon-helix-helix domain-containing protein [Exiguobacterium sp. ZWU0009]